MSFFNCQRGAAIRITFPPVFMERLGHYCSTVIKEPKIFETSSSFMCSTLAVAGLQEISLATVSDPYLWQTVPHNEPLPLVFAWLGPMTCSRHDTVLVLGLRLIKVWKLCTSRGTICCAKKSNFSETIMLWGSPSQPHERIWGAEPRNLTTASHSIQLSTLWAQEVMPHEAEVSSLPQVQIGSKQAIVTLSLHVSDWFIYAARDVQNSMFSIWLSGVLSRPVGASDIFLLPFLYGTHFPWCSTSSSLHLWRIRTSST